MFFVCDSDESERRNGEDSRFPTSASPTMLPEMPESSSLDELLFESTFSSEGFRMALKHK